MIRKPINEVTEAEYRRFPVWRYAPEQLEDEDETVAVPVVTLPCAFMRGLAAVACKLRSADGRALFGVLSGLSPKAEINEHCLALQVFIAGAPARLARFYDLDFATEGPEAFAEKLGAPSEQLFPIAYDVSAYFLGEASRWRGEIRPMPRQPLSEDEFIALTIRAEDDV